MKKIVLLFVVIASLFTSCKSSEDKALDTINLYMKSVLYDYNSYEATYIKVDSAYTALFIMAEPRTFAKTIIETEPELQNAQSALRRAQSSMSIWSDSYDAYGRERYKQAKADVATCKKNIATHEKTLNEAKEGIKNYAKNFQRRPIGWLAVLKYRCNTRGGAPSLGEGIFILDSSFKEILFAIPDFDNEENEIIEIINKYSTQ